MKCDGTRAETRFCLSARRMSPFKSAGASVQSTTGSREVRISGSNAGCTMFRGSVKSTGCPLHSPVSPSLPPPVRHHISTGLYPTCRRWGVYSSCTTNSQSFAVSLGPPVFSISLASASRAVFQTLVFITSSELPAAASLKIHVTVCLSGKSLPYPAIHRNLPDDLNPLYLLLL